MVKQIIDSRTHEVTDIEVKTQGRVISKETAENVLSMMGTVVAEGTGKNAQVAGYHIGGKTGTSEDGVNTNKYVTSFIGVAPITDPEVVILITLYNPTGEGGHQGGAWPILTTHINKLIRGENILKNQSKEIDNLSKIKGGYRLKVGNMYVEMLYSKNNKSFNDCMLNILKQKVKRS